MKFSPIFRSGWHVIFPFYCIKASVAQYMRLVGDFYLLFINFLSKLKPFCVSNEKEVANR